LGLSLEQKQAMVSEVATKLTGAQVVLVAEYRGLDVEKVTQLRSKARKSGLYLRVLKNTLARRAVKGTPFEKLSEKMVGPLMYGISQDPVSGAKVMSEFAKENEQFVIKAGAMPNSMMSAQDVKAQAPVAKLVRTMNEVPGKFVRTLAAYRDSKEKAAA
jgi:large subunit ribosomal protein L10